MLLGGPGSGYAPADLALHGQVRVLFPQFPQDPITDAVLGHHGGQQAHDPQAGIGTRPDDVDEFQHIGQSAQSKFLGLDGDEHIRCGQQHVGEQQPHGRVAVDEHHVVGVQGNKNGQHVG